MYYLYKEINENIFLEIEDICLRITPKLATTSEAAPRGPAGEPPALSEVTKTLVHDGPQEEPWICWIYSKCKCVCLFLKARSLESDCQRGLHTHPSTHARAPGLGNRCIWAPQQGFLGRCFNAAEHTSKRTGHCPLPQRLVPTCAKKDVAGSRVPGHDANSL